MRPSTKDRLEGQFHDTKGKAKEKMGRALGNPKLETDGQNEKVAGKVQKKVGKAEKALGK